MKKNIAVKKVPKVTPQCMFPECTNKGNGSRGCCRAHYSLIKQSIISGGKTWEMFVNAGYCLSRAPGRHTRLSDQFYKLVEKLK